MSFFDFVVDLMWGASEVFIAKRKSRESETADEVGLAREITEGDKGTVPGDARTQREKIERMIGGKTV